MPRTAAPAAARSSAKAAPEPAAKLKGGAKAEPAQKVAELPADEDFADLEADAEVSTAADEAKA